MRILLFTDTLADVNGVSRFIRNIADEATGSGRDLRVLTSTRLPHDGASNIENFRPVFAGRVPRYAELELAWPPARAMLRRATELRPSAIHISTPGPVGLAGLAAARRLGVPVLGVYHTDFPAYVDHLFGDWLLTRTCRGVMRAFYGRFAGVFTRSAEYEAPLGALGIDSDRIVRLRPGIDVSRFDGQTRDPTVWDRTGVPRDGAKILYVGRISVEKNLPLLVAAWKRVVRAMEGGIARYPERVPSLVVVGDGPYREQMQRELIGARAFFPGFRHGPELSAIYAAADVFVFPSATDTLGQVVMEAQCAGLPVLVSDRGGPREVVRDGETGLVLSSSSADAWSDALLSLLGDRDRRAAMGEAARRFVRPMTIRRSFEHFWDVHERAVAGRPLRQESDKPPEGPGVRQRIAERASVPAR